ncbi:hypothetical protein TNCV_505961 [Trichonephila clavipes]|nr:hypothetical protein TNCV_505961 [Trichonephila clavipes]
MHEQMFRSDGKSDVKLQLFSSQASLVLFYRPTEGMEGLVNLSQPEASCSAVFLSSPPASSQNPHSSCSEIISPYWFLPPKPCLSTSAQVNNTRTSSFQDKGQMVIYVLSQSLVESKAKD